MLGALLIAFLGGCAHRHPLPPPPPAPGGPSFVDLEAGWRVRVITAKLKSGGFLMKTTEQKEEGNNITLRAGDEFLGYETATYSVTARKDAGIRVALAAVEFNQNGAITPTPKSFAPRMPIPGRFRRVRLLYMQKVSDADHAMAVLAARDLPRLQLLTRSVQASPETACRSNRNEYCEWIPAGVALRPERPVNQGWAPAR
jgi:hypothetical protein